MKKRPARKCVVCGIRLYKDENETCSVCQELINNTQESKKIMNTLNQETLPVEINSELKQMLVDYVGNKLNPDDGQVSIEMILKVLADEFPEILIEMAEQNFINGYKKALQDVNWTMEEKAKLNKEQIVQEEEQQNEENS